MKNVMAWATHGNNIQPMIGIITEIVMIYLSCIFAILTLTLIHKLNFSNPDCIINRILSFNILRSKKSISLKRNFAFFALAIPLPCGLTFFAFVVPFLSGLAFFTFIISLLSIFIFFGFSILFTLLQTATFANIFIAIFVCSVCIKLRDWFCFFTNPACFCYDCFSHNQLLNSWLRLEPFSEPNLRLRLAYYTHFQIPFKNISEKIL